MPLGLAALVATTVVLVNDLVVFVIHRRRQSLDYATGIVAALLVTAGDALEGAGYRVFNASFVRSVVFAVVGTIAVYYDMLRYRGEPGDARAGPRGVTFQWTGALLNVVSTGEGLDTIQDGICGPPPTRKLTIDS